MLNLYQDIFEGHGATGSRAFTSRSTGAEEDVMDVEKDKTMRLVVTRMTPCIIQSMNLHLIDLPDQVVKGRLRLRLRGHRKINWLMLLRSG